MIRKYLNHVNVKRAVSSSHYIILNIFIHSFGVNLQQFRKYLFKENICLRKIYVFVENLFHGIAVYSGVALVGRLEGKVFTHMQKIIFKNIPELELS